MKYLLLVWSNLKRHKIRTLLTVLCILVAFMLFGYLSAIRQGFNQGISVAGANRLVVRHKVSLIMNLPVAYKTRMERLPGVASAACPGTSNHGWGLAVDIYAVGAEGRLEWLLDNAARFGWSWELQSEPWHIRYVLGDTLP